MSNRTPFPDKDKKALLMTLLKVLGGAKAQVSFDGSGDSGSIDYVNLLDAEGNEINLEGATFDWHELASEFNVYESKWVTTTKPVPNMPVKDILKQITEDALEESGHDWYNDEGGYGMLEIDLRTTPPTINLEVHIRVTTTEDYDIDLTDEEEATLESAIEKGTQAWADVPDPTKWVEELRGGKE